MATPVGASRGTVAAAAADPAAARSSSEIDRDGSNVAQPRPTRAGPGGVPPYVSSHDHEARGSHSVSGARLDHWILEVGDWVLQGFPDPAQEAAYLRHAAAAHRSTDLAAFVLHVLGGSGLMVFWMVTGRDELNDGGSGLPVEHPCERSLMGLQG
jgi:hypothetical protein